MFGRPANPYDEIINKATHEKQTEMNWELALTVWDKVNEEGETGARNSVNALTKRLTHRSANVQLFSLTLAGALVNNCGPSLHREISGKAFTQALTRLINDRTTHESVKKEALKSIEEWVKEHPNNSDFDLMNDTYEALKRQNHKFPSSIARDPSPPRINDDVLRKEEEDLQRALAESAALSNPLRGYQPSTSSSHTPANVNDSSSPAKSLPSEPEPKPTRVQALYDFVGQTPEELEFRTGDVVRVVECLYEDWWKGELRGRVGIFPRNHVQPLPEEPEPRQSHSQSQSQAQSQSSQGQQPTEEDLESEVFAQVALVDRLLALMAQLREQGQDFADNDELTDLYNSSMRLRPRVVKLIRKYDQKQADLQNMKQRVEQARGIYEGMMQQRTQPPPQSLPHGYPQSQPQMNGYHSQNPQQGVPPPSHIHGDPHRQSLPPQAQSQSQYSAQQQSTPGIDPAIEEQQRREYEQKWAEYERQMEEYNRQMAAHQQYYQQQQAPPPSSSSSMTPHDPSFAHHPSPSPHPYPSDPRPASVASPVPSLSRSQTSTSHHSLPPPTTSSQAQPQPQPVWDGQAWVWPAQVASVAQVAPPQGQNLSPAHSPAISTHQFAAVPPHHVVGTGGGGGVVSPLPNTAIYSSPPGTAQPSAIGNLADGVAGMGLSGYGPPQGHGQAQAGGAGGGYYQTAPGSAGGGEDPAQAQWAGR
ncbi:uncharacterized protein JCM6883_001169 [Sporobolomyces salmoneus]|uniref:uncharacterized protein n=1 Tax=Sporobolomyces salmoneus TaxID=183962 RepID=UPI0031828D98